MPDAPDSSRATGPFDLGRTPIHLAPNAPAVALADFGFDGPSFERYIAEHCREGEPGRLMMIETTPTDWPAWECHTEGDEIVVILEGRGTFIQEIGGAERRMAVKAGDTLVNPAGVWHTADVEESIRALYVTPCPGTQHRARNA